MIKSIIPLLYRERSNTRNLSFSVSVILISLSLGVKSKNLLSEEDIILTAKQIVKSTVEESWIASGPIELISEHWKMEGSKMRIVGDLNDPESIFLSGNPAIIERFKSSTEKFLKVTAQNLSFNSSSDLILAEGNAHIITSNSSIFGSVLSYDYKVGVAKAPSGQKRIRSTSKSSITRTKK